MDTYNRGQWGTDPEYNDDDVKWEGPSDSWIKYLEFDGVPEITVGDRFGLQVNVYASDDREARYLFFAEFHTPMGHSYWYLIPDFPSVLMFIREVLPIITEEREQEAHDALMEEHRWKVRDAGSAILRKECAHIP